ncbi:MAG TPA: adenosylcobinamide-phosphate synthase CbiB [Candidatus Bariatricus faecipullorum]|nr:adenosylcobinamide-phosphate synthase CbiB [Candidatus Bariatricus faecipullorum]
MQEHLLTALTAGFILDFILGDPEGLWHPVQGIGSVISFLEKSIRKVFPKTRTGERIGGALLVVLTLAVSVSVPGILLLAAGRISPVLLFLAEVLFTWQMLAVKSLRKESCRVYDALEQEGLPAGRKAVSRIVGRDTERLTEDGVIKAAVETVAENTSDGVVAPLFYLFLAGPLGGFFYKAVNTMDSMVGYQNERYQYFGTAAARLDDVMNWIPARLSALFMMVSALPCGYSVREAWRIYRRDRRNHKSPNAAQTEAVMAGALGIRLAGDAWYFGKRYPKPFIGDASRPVEREDILRAGRLEYATAVTAFAAFAVLRLAAAGLWPW